MISLIMTIGVVCFSIWANIDREDKVMVMFLYFAFILLIAIVDGVIILNIIKNIQ